MVTPHHQIAISAVLGLNESLLGVVASLHQGLFPMYETPAKRWNCTMN